MVVEFRLLGAVEARVDGEPVELGHARQRCVLAVLLVGANQPIATDQLIDRVWGEHGAPRARDTLYGYLSRLRQALRDVAEISLTRGPGGYILTVDPMVVDLHRFRQLVGQARAAAENSDENGSLGLVEEALGLWRGEAFTGLDTPWLNALRDTLERERLAVELDLTDLQLRRGRSGWLLGELTTRAAAHPLDERLAGQVMLALYQCGRQADALEHYQQLQCRLGEELGIDPGPALRRLHEQILTADPALDPRSAGSSGSDSAGSDSAGSDSAGPVPVPAPVPCQLPAHTPHFVGRRAELRRLTTLLDTATPDGGTVVICTIDGTAGIGKTTLAVHWAHQVRDRFPDGQLYVNLRGFDPWDNPVSPVEAVRGLLEALGVPVDRIPVSPDAQAGLYRSLLADRRVLIVLDNARDTDQVRPLLPGSPTCMVVITSRNQLTGLIAQQGACPLTLDVLSGQEATALLARHLGPHPVTAEPDAVAELIDYCARLPMALAIVAARATTNHGFTLRLLAEELADENTRLEALDTGDSTTSVQAAFAWSYQHLSRPAARLFRLLGLPPGPDISLPAAAALADLPPEQARQLLGELTRTHLLTQPTPGRFAAHDLLRTYATRLARAQDTEDERRAALTHLFDHYLYAATAAMDTLHPAEQHRRPRIAAPATPVQPIADPAAARVWLDAELANLTAACGHTAAHGPPGHTTALATTLYRYLDTGYHLAEALAIHSHALSAARRAGDRADEARALTHLGVVCWRQDDYEQAADRFRQALSLAREIGDQVGEARALGNLGAVYFGHGHYEQAAEHHQQALTVFLELGDRAGEANARANLGDVAKRQGRYRPAAEHLRRSLTLCRELDDREGAARALDDLGMVCFWQGRYEQAAEHHQQALALSDEIGYRIGTADALVGLGDVYQRQGRYEQAAEHHEQALTVFREIGDRSGEARALNGVGETRHATGHLEPARRQHAAAVILATEIGDRYELARAHNGLAHTHHATGDLGQARRHWCHALDLYTELDVPDADDIRARLRTLDRTMGEDSSR